MSVLWRQLLWPAQLGGLPGAGQRLTPTQELEAQEADLSRRVVRVLGFQRAGYQFRHI